MISLWQSQQGMDREINHSGAQTMMLMLAFMLYSSLFNVEDFTVNSIVNSSRKGVEMWVHAYIFIYKPPTTSMAIMAAFTPQGT